MKRYLVFLSFLFVLNNQTFGDNSCVISRFYDQNNTTINSIIYGNTFNIELIVNYDGQVPANQMNLLITAPSTAPFVYNNSYNLPNVTAPVIAGNYTFANNNTLLTVPLTGFSTTQFTVHILNVNMPIGGGGCDPSSFTYSSSIQLVSNGTINTSFVSSVSNLSITGQNELGTLGFSVTSGQFSYNNTVNQNAPLYVDFYLQDFYGTYPSNQILMNVVLPNGAPYSVNTLVLYNYSQGYIVDFTTLTPSNGVYTISRTNQNNYYFMRAYFNITAGAPSFNIDMTINAQYNIQCPNPVSGNSFTTVLGANNSIPGNVTVNPNSPVKNESAILNYPTIAWSSNTNGYNFDLNYVNSNVGFLPCSGENQLAFYLDNIYNSTNPASTSNPVVTYINGLSTLSIQELEFDPEMQPTVLVKYVGSTTYQLLAYNAGTSIITIPTTSAAIQSIQMQYTTVKQKLSYGLMIYNAVSSPGANLTYELDKSGSSYYTINKTIQSTQSTNGTGISFYNSNGTSSVTNSLFSINNTYLMQADVVLYNPLSSTDYVQINLSSSAFIYNTSVPLQFSIDGSNFMNESVFQATYNYGIPIQYNFTNNNTSLVVSGISLKGYYANCNSADAVVFIRASTQVLSRPTAVSGFMYSEIIPNGLTGSAYGEGGFSWTIDVTQNIQASVAMSCNGVSYAPNMKIKTNDAFYIQYTLTNLVPYKYPPTTPINFYVNLIKPGVVPSSYTLTLIDGNTQKATVLSSQIPTQGFSNVSFSSCANPSNNFCENLTYSNPAGLSSAILNVNVTGITLDYYDQLILTATYPAQLGLSGTIPVELITSIDVLSANSLTGSAISIATTSDCDPFDCADCVTSFSPIPGNTYYLSAWVKETYNNSALPATYSNSGIQITFNNGQISTLPLFMGSGPIVEGWQRIEGTFTIPNTASNIQIVLTNVKVAGNAYFDDIRIHPVNSNMKSFVYDPSTQKLIAELDENNFATIYEYDDEGILVRVKKETERGVMTIKETRTNQSKIQVNTIKDQ